MSSFIIDLSTHAKEIKYLYDSIVANDPEVSWAVFNYEGATSTLKPYAQGADDLQEFVESFDDGKVQYGFARVTDPNTNLPKFALVGWVGEGIPERVKGYFNAHFSAIAKYFHGYHVQITARQQDDLSVAAILAKIEGASGANYSASSRKGAVPLRPKYAVSSTGASEDDWGDAPPVSDDGKVTKVPSSYKPMKVDIAAIKAEAKKQQPPSSTTAASIPKPAYRDTPDVVKGSYQPVGKVDIAAIRAQAKDSRFNPKPEPLQSSYKPVGKVDIAAIRAEAKKREEFEQNKPETKAPVKTPAKAPEPQDDEEEEDSAPKSVHDRMRAFGGSSKPVPATSFGKPAAKDDEEEEEYRPLSLKDRLSAYSSNAEPSGSSFKAKPKSSAASRFGGGAAVGGTAPPLPKNEYGSSSASRVVGGASRDFGSQGNKTPAQIWAEKHAKKTGGDAPAPVPVNRQPEPEEEEEHHSISDIRSRFAATSVEDEVAPKKAFEEPEEEEEEKAEFVLDAKAKFAQKFAKAQVDEDEEEALPPPPPRRALPPPQQPEEEEEEEEEDIIPLAPPSFPTRPSAVPEKEEESPALPQRNLPPPAALPPRNLPPPPAAEPAAAPALPARNLPPAFVPPAAAPAPAPAHAPAAAAAPPPPPARAPEPAKEEPEEEHADAIVLYDYTEDDDNELTIKENEVVTIVDYPDEKWWTARNEAGEEGLIPSDFVQLLKAPFAVAEYDYEAGEENELSFPEGGVITEIEFVDDEWWRGNYLNTVALFPATYVVLKDSPKDLKS